MLIRLQCKQYRKSVRKISRNQYADDKRIRNCFVKVMKRQWQRRVGYLEAGRNCVFLTLGDPCIYSTYIYVHKQLSKQGYQTEIVSGIPSFLAVSAKLNEGLVEGAQMLHVIPATYQVEEGMDLPERKCL